MSQKRHDWLGLAAAVAPDSESPCAAAQASPCAPPGAPQDRPASSRRGPRRHPPACCRTSARAAAARKNASDRRSHRHRPRRRGPGEGPKRQDGFGLAAGSGAGQAIGEAAPPRMAAAAHDAFRRPPRGPTLSARGRTAAARRAAGGTAGWRPAVGPGSESPCAPAPASSCAPPGAGRDHLASSRGRPGRRPRDHCRTSAPAGAAARTYAPGPRSQGRGPPRSGRNAGLKRQGCFGLAAGSWRRGAIRHAAPRRHRHARRLAHVGGPPATAGDRGAVHQLIAHEALGSTVATSRPRSLPGPTWGARRDEGPRLAALSRRGVRRRV